MSLVAAWDGAEDAEDDGLRSPWDTVLIGVPGRPLPGISRVTGLAARKLDIKKSPGTNGATISDMGLEPIRFEVVVQVWTRSHMQQWSLVAPKLMSPNSPKAFDIEHPSLVLAGVTKVYIERVSLFAPGATPGTFECRLSCVEWYPKPKQVGVKTTRRASPSLTEVDRVVTTPSASGASDPD